MPGQYAEQLGSYEQYSSDFGGNQNRYATPYAAPRLEIKALLYCAAIVVACDVFIQAAETASAESLRAYWKRNVIPATETKIAKRTSGFWFWKKTWTETVEVPFSEDAIARMKSNLETGAMLLGPRIPEKLRNIRAVAAHFKPSHQLQLEGEELALIAQYLAPSEAFSVDAETPRDRPSYTGRI